MSEVGSGSHATLVLGGARSGKSQWAEQLVAACGAEVTYIAPGSVDFDDAEWSARIAAHRATRPADWVTEEGPMIVETLQSVRSDAAVIIDDATSWVAALGDAMNIWDLSAGEAVEKLVPEFERLATVVCARTAPTVVVSAEVGLGIIPPTSSGRVFQDALGTLNQLLARACGRVVMVTAGIAHDLKSAGAHTSLGSLSSSVAIPAVASSASAETLVPMTYELATADTFPAINAPHAAAIEAARERQLILTKPAGSLGVLEDLSVWVSGCQNQCPPAALKRPRVVVFAGDHGIAEHGVSAFPQEVTAQMVANFSAGGAAVNVLASVAGASVRVEDIAVAVDTDEALSRFKVRRASGSIDREDALSVQEYQQAIAAGRAIADAEVDAGADLLIAGDMGIGNTTPSAVLIAAITDREPVDLVGRGTGIDDHAWMVKTAAVRDALFRVGTDCRDARALLRRAGGADLAAMAGFLAQAAVRETPVILDGVVVTAAALMAEHIAPGASQWWKAGHQSVEPAHKIALQALNLQPLITANMRLGEGSGAVTALPLIHAAIATLSEMSTFADAGVSDTDSA